MTTMNMLLPTALLLVHGGHGHDGDAPSLLLRLKHFLTEPDHLVPALLGALVVATVIVLLRRQDLPRR